MKMSAAGRVPRPCIWDFDYSVIAKEGMGKKRRCAWGESAASIRPRSANSQVGPPCKKTRGGRPSGVRGPPVDIASVETITSHGPP